MAQQTFSRGIAIPWWGTQSTLAPSSSTLTTDAANEVAAFIIRAPKAGNIRAVWFMANVGTGADRTIGLYTVDATTGSPTTPPTLLAANTSVVKTLATTDANDFISSGSFTADATVTKGQLMAVCFITPATPGNVLFLYWGDGGATRFPYHSLFTASWAKNAGPGNIMLEYSDGSMEIPLGCVAMGAADGLGMVQTEAFNNGSTPDVRGARFQFPGPVRCNGAWVWADADGDFAVKLVTAAWDGASSGLLASGSVDLDVRATTDGGIIFVEFDATVDLSANTNYRLVVEPSSVTSLSVYHYNCVSAAHLGAQPLGANFHLTTAKDPTGNASFTNYDNVTDGFRVPFMGLIIDGIGDDAGSGGGGRLVGGTLAG